MTFGIDPSGKADRLNLPQIATTTGTAANNGDGTETVTVHGNVPLDGAQKVFMKLSVGQIAVTAP